MGRNFQFGWVFVSKEDVQTLEQVVQRDDGIFNSGDAPDLCEEC